MRSTSCFCPFSVVGPHNVMRSTCGFC
jgi:hypothetical protein